MGLLRRFGIGVAAGLAGVAWFKTAQRRNAALVRPRVRDQLGRPLDGGVFEYADGEIVEYIDAGEGETIVWVPGADGPKETWMYQLPPFARAYRVIAADLRVRFAPEDDFDRFVEDLLELLDARGVDRFTLVGQSLGSAIAIRFASLFPERLNGLVLCNPLARISYDHVGFNRTSLIPIAAGTTKYLPTAASRVLAEVWSKLQIWVFDDSAGKDALIDYALFTGPRTTPSSVSEGRVALLKGRDLRYELATIDVPALVVKGPHDVYCPVSWALEITDRLPDAEYVPIPGTGHCSHISRPGAFNQIVESWLQSIRDRRALGGDE